MRSIDADALEKYLLERGFYPAIVKAAIKNAPSVDAESVIRCKDCECNTCDGCKWNGKRYQKCSCCRRNRNMKDNYKEGDNENHA